MFGSMVLEVAIGVIFVYLLLSLIITAITELISGWLKWRSQNLWNGIRNLVDSGQAAEWAAKLYDHPLIQGLSPAQKQNKPSAATAVADTAGKVTGPSYIPSRTFAVTLLEVLKDSDPAGILAIKALNRAVDAAPETASTSDLKSWLLNEVKGLGDDGAGGALKRDVKTFTDRIPDTVSLADAKKAAAAYLGKLPDRWLEMTIENLPDSKLKKSLAALLDESHRDLESFKKHIEVWFNSSMERVSGWYKRKTQLVQVLLAVAVTVVINVDSVLVVNALSQNQALRDAVVAQAQAFAKTQPAPRTAQPDPKAADTIGHLSTQLSRLDLPVGWVLPGQRAYSQDDQDFRVWPGWWSHGRFQDWAAFWWQTVRFHFLGWLLTAFAISLGAPFWFDMLNKVINIRASGKAPEEKPKSPQAVPQPLEPGQAPST
jgi:hypothetical protein